MAIFTIPNTRYGVGIHTVGPVAIPSGLSRLECRLTRDAWPDTGSDVIRVAVYWSNDGGNSWMFLVGATDTGGEHLDRDNNVIAQNIIWTALPQPDLTNRQIRAEIEIYRALRSAITLEVV